MGYETYPNEIKFDSAKLARINKKLGHEALFTEKDHF